MQHNISGLEPSTKYEFLLAAVNIAGTGEQVKVEEFTSVETGNKVSFLPTKQVPSTIDALTHLFCPRKYVKGPGVDPLAI